MASQLFVEEASDERPLNGSAADDLEAEEVTPGRDQVSPKKKDRKRRMEEKEGRGEEDNKGRASSLDRPSRERKSVERYAALSPIRASATKALDIHQGSGEKLKDIPNVAFKLSKRKADESLRVLHNILFGRKANVHFLKRNILQFSGFVWSQNEEKDKLKVKEKLNKCNKDRLLDLSDLLDVYTLKVNTKKEDISAKLMEFLESPHVTREVMLSEKVKRGKKRKRALKRTGKRTVDEELTDKEKKREKRSRKEPAKDEPKDEGKVDSIDRDDASADEDESTDAEETSENTKSAAEDVEDEHSADLAKNQSDLVRIDGHEELESKQHSPVVRKASLSSSSKKNLDKESKSNVSLESNSKDTNGSSNLSKTSRKDPSSSKKKVDKQDKPKLPSASKASISKNTKGSFNMSAKSTKVLTPSRKKVDAEGEPKVPSESKAVSSKDTKESSKMKVKAPLTTDSKDNNSKRNVSMKGDISKKVDKKKGPRNIGTPSKDTIENKKDVANTDSNNAEKKKGKQSDLSIVPSTEQLSAALSKILKEVDFNVATLADIIRQLGSHFDIDLMDRKAEIKCILEEVINNMTDDEDVEDDHGDGGDNGDGDDEDVEDDYGDGDGDGDGDDEDVEDNNSDGDGYDEDEKN